MRKILVLYDILHNGKTGKFYNNIECILKQNDRIPIFKLRIVNGNIYFNKKIINLENYDIIIFNYNEDKTLLLEKDPKYNMLKIWFIKFFKSWDNYIKYLQFIKQIIMKKKPNMIIYNNPYNHFTIVDTFQNYKFILDNNIPINVPNIKILNKKNIETIDTYPNIISIKEQTGGNLKYLCKNKIELLENYLKLEKTKKEIIICPFLDAYNKDLDCYLSIRIFCINDILIDFISRPSKNWNITNSNIKLDKIILKKADFFLKTG